MDKVNNNQTIKARLNQKIIDSIIKDIKMSIENEKEKFGLEILLKELEITKVLESDNILDIFNKLRYDLTKYQTITNLDYDSKIKLTNILEKNELYLKEHSNNNYDIDNKELDQLTYLNLLLKKIKRKNENNEILELTDIPNINTPVIQNNINKIKKIHLELYKENSVDKQKELKFNLLMEQKKLYDNILNYIIDELNKFFEKNNINKRITEFDNVSSVLDEYLTTNKKEKNKQEFEKKLSKEELNLIKLFRGYGLDLLNYNSDIVYLVEAEREIYERLSEKCIEFNTNIIKRGR